MAMPNDKERTSSCIIVGGGIAGLITATLLQRENIEVTVLDKGRGIGGRLATRRIDGGVFDYGTQYFSVKNPQFEPWVKEWLDHEIITQWCDKFTPEETSKPRYRGVVSTRAIAKYLAQDLKVHTSTRVNRFSYQDSQWHVFTEAGEHLTADLLVLTPPVPQTLTLLEDSQIALSKELATALAKVSYHQCIAVLALLDRPSKISHPGGISLENNPLIWLADNYQKGISPTHSITMHADPEFSFKYWEQTDEEIAKVLFEAARPWIGDAQIVNSQIHRWRYSLPKTCYPEPYCALPDLPLVMAGDAFVAPKIEGAVLSAIAAADYILHQRSKGH